MTVSNVFARVRGLKRTAIHAILCAGVASLVAGCTAQVAPAEAAMVGAEASPLDKYLAGDGAQTVIFKWPVGRFTVTQERFPFDNDSQTCDLWLESERHEGFEVVLYDDGRTRFNFENGRQWNGVGEPVTLTIDGQSHVLDMSAMSDLLFDYQQDNGGENALAATIRAGHTLRVVAPGSAPADFSLAGAAEAFKVLDSCHDEIVAQANARAATVAAAPPASGGSEISLQQQGGMWTVPVTINGALTLNFMIDSGASDVQLPADVMLTLMRTGTIRESDFLGNQTYTLADGSTTVPSPTFRIRSLKVGDREVHNVEASVSGVKGNLLLGQSFLRKFTGLSVDNQRHVLVLGNDAS